MFSQEDQEKIKSGSQSLRRQMGGKPGSRTKTSNKEATETRQEDRARQLRKDTKERDEACELKLPAIPAIAHTVFG